MEFASCKLQQQNLPERDYTLKPKMASFFPNPIATVDEPVDNTWEGVELTANLLKIWSQRRDSNP